MEIGQKVDGMVLYHRHNTTHNHLRASKALGEGETPLGFSVTVSVVSGADDPWSPVGLLVAYRKAGHNGEDFNDFTRKAVAITGRSNAKLIEIGVRTAEELAGEMKPLSRVSATDAQWMAPFEGQN